MKIGIHIALLAFFLSVPDRLVAEDKVDIPKVVFGIDDFCPYTCLDPEYPGILPEAIREILLRSKISLEILPGSWTRLQMQAETGKLDLLGPLTLQLISRLKIPSTQVLGGFIHAGFITLASSKWNYKGIESFKSEKIASIKDYSYPAGLAEYLQSLRNTPRFFELVGADANRRQAQMLANGRVDTIPVVFDVFWHQIFLLKLKTADFRIAGLIELPKDYTSYRIGVFTKDPAKNARLIQVLDKGFAELKKDGSIKTILDRYGILGETALNPQDDPPR